MQAFIATILAWMKSALSGAKNAKVTTKKVVKAGTLAAAVAAASVPTVKVWEGFRPVPYHDIVGVLTVCYGETEGVENRTYSQAECSAMLETRLIQDYYTPLTKCIPEIVNAPVRVQAMVTSTTYNIGVGAACKSTFGRRIQANDWDGACDALLMWNKAGGRTVQGLVNRRADERLKCLGLKPL